jgi:hypothetical protein
MALYLEGKTSVETNELSPKEATQMSHEVKYIGMDVHKEAIVIAVPRRETLGSTRALGAGALSIGPQDCSPTDKSFGQPYRQLFPLITFPQAGHGATVQA